MRSFTSSNACARALRLPAEPEPRVVLAALVRESQPGGAQGRLVRLRPLFDLAQAKHVRQRAARGQEIRVRAGPKVPRADRERLAGERDRAQVFLEGGSLAALAGCLGKNDTLAHDRVALGLLHTR